MTTPTTAEQRTHLHFIDGPWRGTSRPVELANNGTEWPLPDEFWHRDLPRGGSYVRHNGCEYRWEEVRP